MRKMLAALPLALGATASPALAGEADVIAVTAHCTHIGTCDFDATVLHADVGLRHYADRFEVLAPDGEVLGVRELEHPHVHEQPFVRRLIGVEIPAGVSEVTVRARDSQHGYGGREMRVKLELPTSEPKPPGASPEEAALVSPASRTRSSGTRPQAVHGRALPDAFSSWYDAVPSTRSRR